MFCFRFTNIPSSLCRYWVFWLVSFFDPRIAIILPHRRAPFVYDTQLCIGLLEAYKMVGNHDDTTTTSAEQDP